MQSLHECEDEFNTISVADSDDQLIVSLDDQIKDPLDSSRDFDSNPLKTSPSIENKDSVRRSGRERRQSVLPQVGRNLNKPKRNAIWSRSEKIQLLQGLQQVGERDVRNLLKFVPSKKPSQILYYISTIKAKVPALLKNRQSDNAEYWIQQCRQLSLRHSRLNYDPLPLSILLISLFEELPHNDDPDGIDFKSLYEYLFCEMAEVARPNLNVKTKYFLYRSLLDLQNNINDMKKDVLEEVKNLPTFLGSEEWPFSSKVMNPLKFPKVEIEFNI